MKLNLKWLMPLFCAATVLGTEWEPTDAFLRAVSFIESSNGKFTIGDDGESLGEFQLSEAAWLDVNKWRKERSLKTYSYTEYVHHAFINRVYASNYLTILYGELSRKLDREPTHGELYAAYNVGLATFARCDFNLERVNAVTREKCRQIGEMVASN